MKKTAEEQVEILKCALEHAQEYIQELSWKSRSFNTRLRHGDFLNEYIYPALESCLTDEDRAQIAQIEERMKKAEGA